MSNNRKVVVLGSGTIRIGQGMEACHDEYNLVKYLEVSFLRGPENTVLTEKDLNGIEN